MKPFLTTGIAALGLLATATGAFAQYDRGRYDQGRYDQGTYDRGRYDQGGYDRDRGTYDRGSYNQGTYDRSRSNQGGYGYQREPLDRVRADLDRAARDLYYLSGSEMRRFNKVREEIAEFQQKWERGRYDRHEMDDVIGSLQRVVDRNRLEPRDRDMLLNDLGRLRDLRARYSDQSRYGYR